MSDAQQPPEGARCAHCGVGGERPFDDLVLNPPVLPDGWWRYRNPVAGQPLLEVCEDCHDDIVGRRWGPGSG